MFVVLGVVDDSNFEQTIAGIVDLMTQIQAFRFIHEDGKLATGAWAATLCIGCTILEMVAHADRSAHEQRITCLLIWGSLHNRFRAFAVEVAIRFFFVATCRGVAWLALRVEASRGMQPLPLQVYYFEDSVVPIPGTSSVCCIPAHVNRRDYGLVFWMPALVRFTLSWNVILLVTIGACKLLVLDVSKLLVLDVNLILTQ